MVIPMWLASVIAAALVAQLGALALWAIRSDRERALDRQQLSRIEKLLERHDPAQLRSDLDAHGEDLVRVDKALEKLRDDYRTHHSLIRGLQRRLDLGGVPDHGEHTDPGER